MGVLSEGSLRYANAGHLPPLMVSGRRGHASARRATSRSAWPAPAEFEEAELALAHGELLFAYTDGLIEARRAGEVFGHDRLARLVGERAAAHGPEELVRRGARARSPTGPAA